MLQHHTTQKDTELITNQRCPTCERCFRSTTNLIMELNGQEIILQDLDELQMVDKLIDNLHHIRNGIIANTPAITTTTNVDNVGACDMIITQGIITSQTLSTAW